MITGAATEYVMHRMYHSKEPPTEKQAVDWAVQGGSMAIGMFVGQWVQGFEQRLVHLAEGAGQFTRRIGRIKSLTKTLAEHPNKDAALELMIQRHEALEEEARVIEQLAHLPNDKVPPAMLETLRTATPAPGQERVLYPGLSEHEEVEERRANGIPLHKEVIQWFAGATAEMGLAPLDTL